jgi:hypothetical protein
MNKLSTGNTFTITPFIFDNFIRHDCINFNLYKNIKILNIKYISKNFKLSRFLRNLKYIEEVNIESINVKNINKSDYDNIKKITYFGFEI